MQIMNLKDAFRSLHPFKKVYTRIQTNPFTVSRLDFSLISNSILGNINSISVLPSICSDHRVVEVRLCLNKHQTGPGYRKFNNALLYDDNYIAFIRNVIADFKINNPESDYNPQLRGAL